MAYEIRGLKEMPDLRDGPELKGGGTDHKYAC